MEHVLDDINFDNYIVVGVSAGPDSMCLLHLLQKKTTKIVVCHINHNIREQSVEEEEYLKDYCQKHNLIFEKMTIEKYKENNFENEARKRRYAFYEEILHKYNAKYLFLAHHGDDLVETILMKILRGSNIEGYAGIKRRSKVKDYEIIRPLLTYTKEDIKTYNDSHNIKYYFDYTNIDTNYTRNRYRKNILPVLKNEDKDVHLKFLKYSETLQEYNDYIDYLIIKNLPNIYKKNETNINELIILDDFLLKNTLYYIINDYYNNESNIITEKHINSIRELINNPRPNLTLNMPKNKVLVKEYNKLYFKSTDINKEDYKIELKDNLNINNFNFKIVSKTDLDNNSICRLSSKDIKEPLYFRNRKNGDFILLKGSNNKKKIKDIFIECKIPKSERDNYPLLVDSNNNILWIPNIKKSNFCIKVDEKNKNYDIIIKCNEREENNE